MTTDRNSEGAVAWKDKAGTVWPNEYNWAAQFSQLSPGAGFVSMDAGKVYGLARAYAASIPAAEVQALVEADREYDAASEAWDNAPGCAEYQRYVAAEERRAKALRELAKLIPRNPE